jgi:outer membrane protein assembly factor BamB
VYVTWATPDEFALLALTHAGADVWRLNLGPHESHHGFASSPIVVDDKVVIAHDHDGEDRFITAVDSQTGDRVWKISRDFVSETRRKYPQEIQNTSYATPCVRETAHGPEVIFSSWAHGVSSHDLKTGKMNWEAPVFRLRPIGSPTLSGDLIIATCGERIGDNGVFALRCHSEQSTPPDLVYTIKKVAPYVPTPLAFDDMLFVVTDGGIASCFDLVTGKSYWRNRIGGNYFSSPVRVANRIYCLSAEGEVIVLAASKEYELVSRQSLNETCHATPAISGGRMYLRTASHLYSLGGK